MDIEFHYYMTHLIALRAGFKPEDAFKIAYASQYTDDNEEPFRIEGDDMPYESLISQTMDIFKPQEERLSIYPIFHFCPATVDEIFDLAPLRKDGTYHRLDTLPNNTNARNIFKDAMSSGNLHRIGIGTHMFADTFCHRDFVGYKATFNWLKIDGLIKGLLDNIVPCIGHALAIHQPDIPALVWEDTRLISKEREKKNKNQILAAAGHVFDFFCQNTKPAKAAAIKKTLLGDLGAAIGADVEADSSALNNSRNANYRDLLGSDYKKYNKEQWFDAAVDRQVDGQTVGTSDVQYHYYWKDDYQKSDWHAFQEAVKAHQAVAFKALDKTFKAMEIDIAKGN